MKQPGGTMKQIAQGALETLANRIYDGCSSCWIDVDRIERRWRMAGYAESIVVRLNKQHQDFLKAESRKHDSQHPNRLTYLHR